jgi:rod shape-determining protein MreB
LISGLPREAEVSSVEVREALKEPIGQIIDCVLRTLERAEPELAADLAENGLHLAGGGALLKGMTEVMRQATGLHVELVDDPLSCVARGTSVYLENLSTWKDTLESDVDEY